MSKNRTSWQSVSKWYNEAVGIKGSYYHRQVIIPKVLGLLRLQQGCCLLDLGCGQGVLARYLPKNVDYYGVDLASGLLEFAQKRTDNPYCHFVKADITRPLPLDKKDFTHAAIILALQNVSQPDLVIKNAADHLITNGKLIVVINHPCFRIPRQSSWQIDKQNKIQYKRINRYLTPLKIPINMKPSQERRSAVTWTFHFSLSNLSQYLYQDGFVIEKIEEWISDKISQGKAARMENRSRKEFPLFLAVLARKKDAKN